MKIERPVFFIGIKGTRPVELMCEEHCGVDEFEDAYPYYSRQEAENTIKTYDEPENYEIVEGKMMVQI